MGKLSIVMSDQVEKVVSDRVQSGEYSDASEYVSDLVLQDQKKRAALAELGRMIDKADAGGFSERTPREIWEGAEARFRQRRDAE